MIYPRQLYLIMVAVRIERFILLATLAKPIGEILDMVINHAILTLALDQIMIVFFKTIFTY